MKKSIIGLAVLAVASLAMTSCSKDSDPVDNPTTLLFTGEITGGPTWIGTINDDSSCAYKASDFVSELNKIGYFADNQERLFYYSVETTESKKDTVTKEYTEKYKDYYINVLNKIEQYDFSSRLTAAQKKTSYSYSYNVTASYNGLDLSIHINVCNPQLVKGMTYVSNNASAPIKSFTIDNGVLNHFNTAKTATVVFSDGTTKTMDITESAGAFSLGDDYAFSYAGTDYTDTSSITDQENKTITYRLQ